MTRAGEPPVLRGRHDEVAALVDALGRAAVGIGATVLIEGEAGIGKTRLLEELSSRAHAREMTVRHAAAEELEQDRPFGPLLAALGAPDAVPQLGEQGWEGVTDARFLTQDAYVDHVERLTAAGPLMLSIDDIQWADRATVATLWALARRTAPLGCLLVLAARPTPRSAEVGRLVAACQDLDALHLALTPIDEASVEELATDLVGGAPGPALLEELHRARGNPFVAIELLRTLDAEGRVHDIDGARELEIKGFPVALRDTLVRRMTALSDAARRLLSAVAVLSSAPLADVAALLDVAIGEAGIAVDEATRAGLLESEGDLVAFRHDLLREALYLELPEPVRAGWHVEAARRLEGRAPPSVIARHLVLGATAGGSDAVEGLRRAAHALVGQEPDASVDLLARALELECEQATAAEIEVELAETLLAAGRSEDASRHAGAALERARVDPALSARAHLAAGDASFFVGESAAAYEHFRAARGLGVLDEATSAHALARQAASRLWSFDLDGALEDAGDALAEARRLGSAAVAVDAAAVRCGVLGFRGEFDQAIVAGRETVALAGDDPAAMRHAPHTYLALALYGSGDMVEARAVAELGRRRSTELGHVSVLPLYQTLLGRIAWCAGRWHDAITEADTADALAEDFGLELDLLTPARGLIAFHRGDETRAIELAGRLGEYGGAERPDPLGTLLAARLAEARGDGNGAAAIVLGRCAVERAVGVFGARMEQAPIGVRLALAMGDEEAAREIAADIEAIVARVPAPATRGFALHARGLVDRDVEALVAAAEELGRAGRPLDRLEALEAAAGAYAAAQRRDDAVSCLESALAIADELGATRDGRRLSAALRDLGVRLGSRQPKRRADTGWDSLTETEREVAALVGQGLRNAEIADRMFVSRRTVESHVSHLYAKLGLSTRVVLANAVRERHR